MQDISNIPQQKEHSNTSNPDWKAVFAPLSERRRLLGAASFLRTHIPLVLESEQGLVLEEILMQNLLQETSVSAGNRVWFISGGPGAGKSELLEWLSLSIAQHAPHRYPFLLHIHQYEADIVKIAARVRSLLPEGALTQEQHLRWNEVRKKPRTIAKLLLLLALDQLLQSDDESYGLYYALADLVDTELRYRLEATADGASIETGELFRAQAWELLQEQTSQPVPFSYDAFHQALQAAFHSYLFSGLSLPMLMRSVSDSLQADQGRPILLMDDLVSSLHVWAPDLVSMLISTAGSWDVILGVTPENRSKRGTDFLDHLADYPGAQGYYRLAPFDERQCLNLARAYLLEQRRIQGIDGIGLAPFNEEVLVRLLHGLPAHRRTPRAFLRHLEVVLEQEGDAFLAQLSRLALPDYAVLIEDSRLARIGELYGPRLASAHATSIRLASHLCLDLPQQEVILPIQPLLAHNGLPDEQQTALFQWLGRREETSTVTLTSLRKGAARLLQETLAIGLLGVPAGSTASLLCWQKAYKGISPPLLLAGEWRKSNADGILLDWSVGSIAFDLAQYGTATGSSRQTLAAYLRNAPQLVAFFEAAQEYQRSMQQELERQLTMSLEQFALIMFLWSLLLEGQTAIASPALLQTILRLRLLEHSPDAQHIAPTSIKEWQQFFQDLFSLTQSKLDEERMSLLGAGIERQTLLNILDIEPSTIGKPFRWRGQLLSAVLQEWQQMLAPLRDNI